MNILTAIKNLFRKEDTRMYEITIDTETTGFSATEDELLQVSIINGRGDVLYDGYLRPTRHTSWEKAERVNGISPDMVKDKPTIEEELPKIKAIISSAKKIIGYNTQFDLGFLKENGCEPAENTIIVDVMRDFAPIYGEWLEEKQEYKWKKLSVCADYYGYDWGNTKAHNSLADCFATLFCYNKMADNN